MIDTLWLTANLFFGKKIGGEMTEPIDGGPPQATTPPETNGLAVAALVVGISAIVIGLFTAWIPVINFFPLMIGVVGVVLGVLGMKGPTGKGMSIAGLVCSVITIAVVILSWVFVFFIVGVAASAASGG